MASEQLEKDIRHCTKCRLSETRTNAVPGQGPTDADIMLIGEAPGANEDQQGEPFVGRAGRILDELLAAAGLDRKDVYITNIVKCRPPGNRNPADDEIRTCTPYLARQVETIKPRVIIPMGNFATRTILKKYGLADHIQGISKLHSTMFTITTLLGKLSIMPAYHPAVATYDASKKDTLKEDFRKLKETLRG